MAPRRQPADASTLRRPAAASRSRSPRRVAYDQWVARCPNETPEEHDLRLLDFYIFLLETERVRIRASGLEALARSRRNLNNVEAAREQRVALLAILATRRSGAPETRGSGP